MIEISNYLRNKSGDKGHCKSCNKVVSWARAKVLSHKRKNCDNISEVERSFFNAQRQSSTITQIQLTELVSNTNQEIGPQLRQTTQQTLLHYMDQMTIGNRDDVVLKLSRLFFRTGMSFRIIESVVFKDFIKAIRPAFISHVPSAKVPRTTLLTKMYDDLFAKGKSFIENAPNYSLVTDGWSNIRGEHIVNFVVVTPNDPPFFCRAHSTVGIPQTAAENARVILEVMEELGTGKCVSIVTDNASNMRGAWDIIEATHPIIFANECAAHVMNLVIKDICELADFKEVLSKGQFIVTFVKSHGHVDAKYQSIRVSCNISKTLIYPIVTCWYTNYNACDNLMNSRFAMTTIGDEAEILGAIASRDKVSRFKLIIDDHQFWARLKVLIKVLKFPTALIGKFESNQSDIHQVSTINIRFTKGLLA